RVGARRARGGLGDQADRRARGRDASNGLRLARFALKPDALGAFGLRGRFAWGREAPILQEPSGLRRSRVNPGECVFLLLVTTRATGQRLTRGELPPLTAEAEAQGT